MRTQNYPRCTNTIVKPVYGYVEDMLKINQLFPNNMTEYAHLIQSPTVQRISVFRPINSLTECKPVIGKSLQTSPVVA